MLKELLNEFMDHQNQYPEFDVDTMLMQNYRLKPGLYLRIKEDGGIDEFYATAKTELPDNDPLVEWFKQADFASSLIEMNKPVDPKKQIHSNNRYTLFCKLETFCQNKQLNLQFVEHIDRYFSSIVNIKDKTSSEILAAAGYEPLVKEVVEECKVRLSACLDEVVQRINHHDIKDNCYIKLFLDVGLEKYFHESGRYLLPRIFNSNDYNETINGQVFGLSNANMGMNAKKPYLEHKTTEFKVPYRITADEGVLLHKFFIWLNGIEREGKPLYSGYLPLGKHSPGLFAEVTEMNIRKPAAFLHLDKGMSVTIDDYDFIPSFGDKMDKPLQFINYLEMDEYPAGTLNALSAVEAHINLYLYGGQLIRNYYADKIQISDNLSQTLIVQLMMTRKAMHSWLRKGDDSIIQHSVDQLTKGVVVARLQNLKYISELANALNVRLSLLRYFKGEENDMGDVIAESYRALKDKVLDKDNKEQIICQDSVEFYLAVGQTLYYFFSLSEAQRINYDVLWRGIVSTSNAAGVKAEHNKYFKKYAHAINIDNPRFNRLLCIVTSYAPAEEEPVNLDALLFGFAADSIIYYKDKKDNEDKSKDSDKEESKE